MIEAFTEAGAAVAGVYDARDLTEDEHVRETQMLTEVDDDDLGPVLQHNVMWRMSREPRPDQVHGSRGSARTPTTCSPSSATTTTRSSSLHEEGADPVTDPAAWTP